MYCIPVTSDTYGDIMIIIQENAIFVADAHYPTHGDTLLKLLYQIMRGEIVTSQLFLMGDIFDLLIGGVEQSIQENHEAIGLIESIAKHIEVYYFEGNHDFLLASIFTNIKIYPREQQPQMMSLGGCFVGLSHGDRFAVGWKHALMSRLLRKAWVIRLIQRLRPQIVSQQNHHLSTKDICIEIPHFEQKTKQIMAHYKDTSRVIEGHYHQAIQHYGYISLPALACQKQVGVIRDTQMVFVDCDSLSSG